MELTVLFKVIGVGLLVAVAHQILCKSGREDVATWVSVAGLVLVLLLLMGEIKGLFDKIKQVFGL